MQIPTKEAFSPYVGCKRRTPPVRSMKDYTTVICPSHPSTYA